MRPIRPPSVRDRSSLHSYPGSYAPTATAATAMVTTAPVTIEQAAALLGVSASTIRRRIRAGALQVEEVRRPQGIVWMVHLPAGVRPATDVDTAATAPVDTAPSTQPAPLAQAEAISGLVQATLATVLGPLVAELAASRQTVERQAEEIATLREDRGRLTAERDAAQAAHTSILAAQSAEPTPEPPAPVWQRWAPLGFSLLAVVLAAALLAWPR